jgi:hypothetical protein
VLSHSSSTPSPILEHTLPYPRAHPPLSQQREKGVGVGALTLLEHALPYPSPAPSPPPPSPPRSLAPSLPRSSHTSIPGCPCKPTAPKPSAHRYLRIAAPKPSAHRYLLIAAPKPSSHRYPPPANCQPKKNRETLHPRPLNPIIQLIVPLVCNLFSFFIGKCTTWLAS